MNDEDLIYYDKDGNKVEAIQFDGTSNSIDQMIDHGFIYESHPSQFNSCTYYVKRTGDSGETPLGKGEWIVHDNDDYLVYSDFTFKDLYYKSTYQDNNTKDLDYDQDLGDFLLDVTDSEDDLSALQDQFILDLVNKWKKYHNRKYMIRVINTINPHKSAYLYDDDFFGYIVIPSTKIKDRNKATFDKFTIEHVLKPNDDLAIDWHKVEFIPVDNSGDNDVKEDR